MCVLPSGWPVESAGDGGGGKHVTGDDVKGPEVIPHTVSTGVNDAVFERTSGEDVAETGVGGPTRSRPIEKLLES